LFFPNFTSSAFSVSNSTIVYLFVPGVKGRLNLNFITFFTSLCR
jgi:hypothetical protein